MRTTLKGKFSWYPKFDRAKITSFFSKLSGSFFLIIAIMPFAGLCLGIGSAIVTQSSGSSGVTSPVAYDIGLVVKSIGDTLFSNLPIFFAVAMVIVFTGEGISAITALFAYFLFLEIQYVAITIALPNNTLPDTLDNLIKNNASFKFLFWNHVPYSILNYNFGILSLNTSVFGGVIIGMLSIWCYNKFKTIKLPSFFSFFGGNRFVPMASSLFVPILSFIFLMSWPGIGQGLTYLGQESAKLPAGVDSFVVFWLWRILTPFGVHHAFYSIFWWTSAGGSLDGNWFLKDGNSYVTLLDWLKRHTHDTSTSMPQGDSNIYFAMLKWNLPFTTQFFLHYDPITKIASDPVSTNPGRFLGGNFPVMIGGYLGATLAVFYHCPKKDRKVVMPIVWSGYLTSCAIGLTEPFFWLYLLVSPFLFFGFHSFMAGVGSMLLFGLPRAINPDLGFHTGTAFSCGILDSIIFGILPYKLGTNFYWIYVWAVIFLPIYFLVFYYYMKWKKIFFPVLDSGIALTDVKAAKAQVRLGDNSEVICNGLGGVENITSVTNCASRVRVVVLDPSKVDEKILMSTGAFRVLKNKDFVQIVYGPKADSKAVELNNYLNIKKVENNHQKI
ncbi:PTS transporter subunit EIIC [symbiont of Argiope bruennichi]|uniref:PTS transporter subunit EIIC n=1 Tax=symbiont of Argiope bruennichi TaxID=2810479 RepID=UPI003DA210A7